MKTKPGARVIHSYVDLNGYQKLSGFAVIVGNVKEYEFSPDNHGFTMAKALASSFNRR